MRLRIWEEPRALWMKVDGAISLWEHGMISKDGWSLIDDSASMVITEDGWVTPRGGDGLDVYFFGYGRRYQECIRDFYRRVEIRLCFRGGLLETGGADIINIQKKNIRD